MWPNTKMENQRFYKCNETEIESLIDKTKNHSTESSTKTWINVFQSWAKERGFPQEVSAYEPENLDKTLCIFYTEIRTKDGNQYEPDGEVENSKFSETSENQFSEVFNSEFSVLYHTQNRKVGVENLGDLL